MWIRQLPSNYKELSSSFSNSLMLWQNEKVYVMDNHLSAASFGFLSPGTNFYAQSPSQTKRTQPRAIREIQEVSKT